jgi:hypothetical protein
MTVDYQFWSREIQQLDRALTSLEPLAAAIGVPPPQGEEWFELLRHKLLPQVMAPPVLIVAVVGGTNIGKSAVFNQLTGERASAVSPLAAGTKHPVCLVPPGCDNEQILAPLFKGFQLRAWQSAEEPLVESEEHLLFYRASDSVPPELMLLDTPDIDSDAEVNWRRADIIRQSADVLIAVLTQQKYNDAAVKRFFRNAAEAGKPVIVVFNQCDLQEDQAYWPNWLATFADETGAHPEIVYVVPYDRVGANTMRLPFYAVGCDGRSPPGEASDLRADLRGLHFDRIKTRTLRGALARVLDREQGAWAYLAQLRRTSGEFEAAAKALSATQMARVRWPTLPPSLLVEEIRQWWDENRHPLSRSVHGFYRTVGQGVTWPVRTAWQAVTGPAIDPLQSFRAQERETIAEAIGSLLAELDRLAQVGNETLRPRLQELLGGAARGRLMQRVQAAHAELPAVDDDYRAFLRSELARWGQANDRAVGFLRSLDHVAAIARPAITVSLVLSGWVLAGDVVGQAAVHVAGHTATQIATDAAITGSGEAVVSMTGEGIKQGAARLFGRLQIRYAELRAAWLANWLEREFLGGLLAELRRGAELPQSASLRDVEKSLRALSSVL